MAAISIQLPGALLEPAIVRRSAAVVARRIYPPRDRSHEPRHPRAAPLGRKESDLLVDQLRAIDNRRLIEGPLTHVPAPAMRRVEEAIRAVLDFAE